MGSPEAVEAGLQGLFGFRFNDCSEANGEIAMQPNRKYNFFNNDDLSSPYEDSYALGDEEEKPTVLILVAKNIILLGSVAIMLSLIVAIVAYIF